MKSKPMNRRHPLGMVTALLGLGLGLSGATENKPNVLFVIVDDLNCRIACYGDPAAKTLHLDRLAARGVTFDRVCWNFPLGNPTRSSVLSGQYPTTTGVLDNKTWLSPQSEDQR